MCLKLMFVLCCNIRFLFPRLRQRPRHFAVVNFTADHDKADTDLFRDGTPYLHALRSMALEYAKSLSIMPFLRPYVAHRRDTICV